MTKIDITLAPEVKTCTTYSRGDCFLVRTECDSVEELYMLVSIDQKHLTLVSLASGNRWSNVHMEADLDSYGVYENTLDTYMRDDVTYRKVDRISIKVE